VRPLLRSLEVATHETDHAIELIRNLSETHIDVRHTLFVHSHALLHIDDVLGLKFLYLSLAALDLCHHHRGVLKLPDFVLEVHLSLV